MNKQRGLSITELMISMLIGLILLAGIIQILISNRQTSRTQEALAQIQDNGRIVMEYLAREIRKADYWGCTDISNFVNHLDTASAGYDPSSHDFSAMRGLVATDGDGLNGSDSITLAGMKDGGLGLTSDMPNTSAVLNVVKDNNAINNDDILFVSNCAGGDIFQVTSNNAGSTGVVGHNSGSGSPGNVGKMCNTSGSMSCPNCFCQTYGTEATLFTGVREARYFIAANAEGVPTLNVTNNDGTFELAEGVEQMQITYGEDTNGDGSADRYVPASNATLNIDNAVSVKINLLVRSSEQVASNPIPHRFNWEERLSADKNAEVLVEPADRRLRRSYTMTVSIRNRVI